MIIVQLRGGLGNQLFQYAAGLALARYHRVELKVDVSLLQNPDEEIGTVRNFELGVFVPNVQIAEAVELRPFANINLLKKVFERLLPPHKRSVHKEANFSYDTQFFNSRKHVYLKGYRQSEQYFKQVADEVRSLYQLKNTLINNVSFFEKELKTTNSISIHIRRGDYNHSKVAAYHGALTPAYYSKAIDAMMKLVEVPKFYIFSDDIDWVNQNIQLPADATIVSKNISHTHYEDFYLMSQCRYNIIANSSFSWWAAWLNNYSKKQVIAPRHWFGNAKLDTKDLIPQEWTTI